MGGCLSRKSEAPFFLGTTRLAKVRERSSLFSIEKNCWYRHPPLCSYPRDQRIPTREYYSRKKKEKVMKVVYVLLVLVGIASTSVGVVSAAGALTQKVKMVEAMIAK